MFTQWTNWDSIFRVSRGGNHVISRRFTYRDQNMSETQLEPISPAYIKRSEMFIPIRWNTPSETRVSNHQLLIQAGYIRQTCSGIYSYLPLANRIIDKITIIIDQEMQRIGGQKMHMSKIQPKSIWAQSNRWEAMGSELFRLQDRKLESFCLAPTHEELVTMIVAADISSPKQLPLKLYQIGDKYRDEIRPRYGLIRGREFIMKDMYSFDISVDMALKSYNKLLGAYHLIMKRLQIPYVVAEADSGNIGGNLSHEFHALSKIGEDTLLYCPSCHYHANLEKAVSRIPNHKKPQWAWERFKTELIDMEQILCYLNEVGNAFFLSYEQTTNPFRMMLVVINKGYQLNTFLLNSALLKAKHDLADFPNFQSSPINQETIRVFLDLPKLQRYVMVEHDIELESSQKGENIDARKNLFNLLQSASDGKIISSSIKFAQVGDLCPGADEKTGCISGERLKERNGVEVGHLFYLGQKYSQMLKANVAVDGKKIPMEMGCYGIGVSRLVATAAECFHDKNGLCWPASIAPYRITVFPVTTQYEEEAKCICNLLNQEPKFKGEIILDDRINETFGYKLRESQFLGIPFNVIVGRDYTKEKIVEVEMRSNGEKHYVQEGDLAKFLASKIQC